MLFGTEDDEEKTKTWALSDSSDTNQSPCNAFQAGSLKGRAWLVHATSPATKRYDRLRKECDLGLFIMDCVTTEEARALSIIHRLNVEQGLAHFIKWGPSARICLRLARGSMTEDELENDVVMAAKKFAEDPLAVTMDTNLEATSLSHLLFTTCPVSPKRDISVLRVPTPHLQSIVNDAIANIDAARQASFYSQASSHPFFRSTFGYIFEKFFYVWLSSTTDNELLCTQAPASSQSRSAPPAKPKSRSTKSRSTAHEQVEQLRLQPVGWAKVNVHGGDSGANGYKSANRHKTPFAWIPASRSDATFDAVICTDTRIITIQVTVAAKHSVNTKGFETLERLLPKKFQKARKWCHVFVTNHPNTALQLRKMTYTVGERTGLDFSIHTAVLDISLFTFPRDVLNRAMAPSDVEMEIDAEGEQQMTLD
ncbi:hypothetical protein BGY98DRAFT_952734 [Russula aff. rugulosa BPL654]|nr:hypothetical protein BGY98DRAFT_952734 [Russula aff. rugulosa BPL654]